MLQPPLSIITPKSQSTLERRIPALSRLARGSTGWISTWFRLILFQTSWGMYLILSKADIIYSDIHYPFLSHRHRLGTSCLPINLAIRRFDWRYSGSTQQLSDGRPWYRDISWGIIKLVRPPQILEGAHLASCWHCFLNPQRLWVPGQKCPVGNRERLSSCGNSIGRIAYWRWPAGNKFLRNSGSLHIHWPW